MPKESKPRVRLQADGLSLQDRRRPYFVAKVEFKLHGDTAKDAEKFLSTYLEDSFDSMLDDPVYCDSDRHITSAGDVVQVTEDFDTLCEFCEDDVAEIDAGNIAGSVEDEDYTIARADELLSPAEEEWLRSRPEYRQQPFAWKGHWIVNPRWDESGFREVGPDYYKEKSTSGQ